MKFAIKKGSSTYDKMEEILQRMQKCNKQALELAEQIYLEVVGEKPDEPGVSIVRSRSAAGGIRAIEFKEKPKGWVNAETPNYRDLFKPSAKNKAMWERINALEEVSRKEVAKIVGYESPQTYTRNGQMIWSECCGIEFLLEQGVILVECDDEARITPVEGMEEILSSEYQRCIEQSKKEKVA